MAQDDEILLCSLNENLTGSSLLGEGLPGLMTAGLYMSVNSKRPLLGHLLLVSKFLLLYLFPLAQIING